ncbi:MAG TPA: helix-turn-helix domain-containing protein [Bdellovibrionota bacterium]|jgi:curved DNA-binding protein CbpA|nr:helix-turn-helix domain-containing protein [Bdellovibrionota bacterium]
MSASNASDGGNIEKKEKNLYLVLDLAPGVTQNEILHAYNRAKATYSTNSLAAYSVMDEEDNSSVLEEIEAAYRVLGNPSKRREYDMRMGFETWAGAAHHEERAHNYTDFVKRSGVSLSTPSSSAAAEKKKHLAAVPDLPESQKNSDFEKEIAGIKELTGAFVRSVRIYRQLSQEQLAVLCKLSVANLAIVEDENGGEMSHPTYVRGHVVLICQTLGLPDPNGLAKSFIARMKSAGHFGSTPLF